MIFSDVCYVNSLMKRRRMTNGLGFANLCLLPSILETQLDCCLRSGEQSSIGHDLESETRSASNTSSSSLNRNKSVHKKSCDKNIFKDCSAMNPTEDQLYEKLSDFDNNNVDSIYYEEKNISEDTSETVVNSEDETNSEFSSKSSLFPSLPDVILRKLQLLRESSCSVESLTEEEIESKFTTLSLAFKTDKLTLEQRLNLQKHQRDVAEADANNELRSLRETVRLFNQLMFGSDDDFILSATVRTEVKELLQRMESQVEVVGQTNAKISSRSELYGAAKQEERMSAAFDVILIHSQNLKKETEKCRKELEKTKKLLNSVANKKPDFESDSDNESVPLRRSIRSISTTILPKLNLIRVRRASVSSLEVLPNLETQRKSVQNNIRYAAPKPSYLSNRSRRCSMPATSAMFRPRNGVDSEPLPSYLEITAEEKGGSESDGASSAANPDSDNERTEQTTQSLTPRKSSINELNNTSINNNNTRNAIITDMNDTYSHRIVSNDITNDCDEDSCDEDTNDNDFDDKNSDESKTIVDLIEFKYLVNLYNQRFDGRVGSIVRSITTDFRLVLSLTLLIIAMVIMVWSLLPIGFPCECRCSYSWYQILSAILMSHSSQDIVSPIQ